MITGIITPRYREDTVREIGQLKTDYSPTLDRIEDIKVLLRALSYGEFTEAAKGMKTTADDLWTWCIAA